jgi:hypothetical protein
MQIMVSTLVVVAVLMPADGSAQVRRGRALEPEAPPWAPIAIGVRFGYDQEVRTQILGGGLRIPIVRNGVLEFNPNADIVFVNGPNEHSYNLDLAYVPGGARGGLVLAGGVGWRESSFGLGETFFGYNLGLGGKSNLGPVQIEALIRWAFLQGTEFQPNTVSLGLNYPLWRARPRR